jgi:hypothetical protein
MDSRSHPENESAPPRPGTLRLAVALCAAVLVGLGLTMIFISAGRSIAKKAKVATSAAQPSALASPSNGAFENQKSKIENSAEPPSPLADELNSPRTTIWRDLQVLNGVLLAWQTNFHEQGNPVGDNAAITAALTGKNPLNFQFVRRNHPAINASGELCDRWGTPFFFHALSGTRMEIRSAGPDRQMYTDDDVVFTP